MANGFILGDAIRITAAFSVDGTPTDPTTLAIQLRDPAGALIDYVFGEDVEIVRESAGTFHLDLIPSLIGLHRYIVTGTGDAQKIGRSAFRVKAAGL